MSTAAEILAELRGEHAPAVKTGRLQESRTGKIVRVADLKYLKESRGMNGMATFLAPGVAKVVEKLEPLFLNESWDDWDSIANLALDRHTQMREATSASAFGQLLRAGVQTIANDFYLRTAISWPSYVREYASNKRAEYHAPLFGSKLPQRTSPQEPYKETGIVGQDIELINYKYMGGESIERELWEDDQTGQIRQRAQNLGEAQRLIEEIYSAGRMLGLTNFSVANFGVPASNWQGVNANQTKITVPYSPNLYATGSGNMPGTFAQLSASALAAGIATLMGATDPFGIKIMVKPNKLVVSVNDALRAKPLLNSPMNPSVQGVGGTTYNNQLGGTIGGIAMENMFKGLLDFDVNYFFPAWAWTLGEAKKGPVFQRRTPMEVVQEVPNSGASFDLDAIRWRTRSRWEMDWISPYFWYLGNPGTGYTVSGQVGATGQQ